MMKQQETDSFYPFEIDLLTSVNYIAMQNTTIVEQKNLYNHLYYLQASFYYFFKKNEVYFRIPTVPDRHQFNKTDLRIESFP